VGDGHDGTDGGRPAPPTSRAIAMFGVVLLALALIAVLAWTVA
jgi:hypothetical protein